ncbi:uncharacterized protein LOC144664483 [Oculina patagonica]
MSYSRTYRNSNGVAMNRTNINGSQRGREMDRTNMYGSQRRNEIGEGSGAEFEQVNQRQTEETPRQERGGGYTMFRPDERKRAHLLEVAKRETEAAQARSEARRSRPIHERPQRLGGAAGHYTAITQKQKAVSAASKGLETQKKREKWQREKREREERENQEKKAKARAQAERNEILQAVRAQDMRERHRDAHRWKNQEFLDKLEERSSYDSY